MSGEEEYELMPHKSIDKIKFDIEDIKKKVTSQGSPLERKELLDSVDNLTKSINQMMGLFKMAGEELKLEEKKEEIVAEKIDPLLEKIDTLLEQNQKIAKGIVAVADLVKEAKGKPHIEERKPEIRRPIARVAPKPRQRPIPLPGMTPPVGAVPPPPMPPLGKEMPPRMEASPIPPRPPGLGEIPPLPKEEAGLPPFEFEEEKPKKKGLFGMFKKK